LILPDVVGDLGALGLTVAAVIALWKIVNAYSKKDAEKIKVYEAKEAARLAQCEIQHKESSDQVTKLTGEIKSIEGKMSMFAELSTAVIEKISEGHQINENLLSHAKENKALNKKILAHITKD